MSDLSNPLDDLPNGQAEVVEKFEQQHAERIETIRREYQRTFWLILLVAIFFVMLSIASAWFANQLPNLPTPNVASVDSIRLISSSHLCPGEVLEYEFRMVGVGSGVLEMDTSIIRLEPPYLVMFSEPRRMVLDGPVRIPVSATWTVPERLIDAHTGAPFEWLPGRYVRTIGVSTSSRNTVPAVGRVYFSIREDC